MVDGWEFPHLNPGRDGEEYISIWFYGVAYYGARSNEFVYVNYEIIPPPQIAVNPRVIIPDKPLNAETVSNLIDELLDGFPRSACSVALPKAGFFSAFLREPVERGV